MHSSVQRVRERVERVRRERLRPAVYPVRLPADVSAWHVPGEPVPFEEACRQAYAPLARGERWGRPWGTTWLHATAIVPGDWSPGERHALELVVDLGFCGDRPGFQAEGLVLTPAGEIVQAVEPRNQAVRLTQRPGERVEVYVEAAANPDLSTDGGFTPTPLGSLTTAGAAPLYVFRGIDLAIRDVEVWELERDLDVLEGLLDHLPVDRPRHAEIVYALTRMIEAIDPSDVAGTAPAARAALAEVLARPADASAHRIVATGHAHIDSAWLWPARETVRKCARTFSNVLNLMDADDRLVFACSSAQQLAWVRDAYPDLFARILARVREGRFVPVGGMWVESDTNMPGSEAMARQFVEGGAFFRDVLGVEAREAWLPDSFGYSAALPQIAVAAGARWFLTQKMSWNDTNALPHHTFWWEGIDGTRIFTHFPPADTYGSDLSIADLDRAERQFADKGPATMSLLPFGYGDGGGGPTREMLAAARRERDLEGSPRVEIAAPGEFFARAEAEYGDRAPTWSGEMYLELHRGVYTSQARTKRGNRRCEQALHDAELWATTAMVRVGTPYPADELRALWRTVLLQQFHDILPGSSIAWVYEDAERNYVDVEARACAITDAALAALVGPGDVELTVNPTPVPWAGVPAMGVAEAAPGTGYCDPRPDGDGWLLDNGAVRVRIDAAGLVSSFVDLTGGREIVPAGARAAVPQLFDDTPTKWDAWDVDALDRARPDELTAADKVASVLHEGRPSIEVTRTFGRSQLVQRYALATAGTGLEITLDVDWQEREHLLKLAFPLDVLADRYASQTQFGHVYRPVHRNTSWDAARFEVCAHRFVHVAEEGFGVAVVNTATYGHDVSRVVVGGRSVTQVRPTLLRAPRFPDPDADRGEHALGFRLVVGGIDAAVAHGYAAAAPARAVRGAEEVPPLVRVDGDGGVLVETVKAAQDGTGDVVVRLYESRGTRARARLVPGFVFSSAAETDLHERPTGALVARGGGIDLDLRAFALRTIRLRPAGA